MANISPYVTDFVLNMPVIRQRDDGSRAHCLGAGSAASSRASRLVEEQEGEGEGILGPRDAPIRWSGVYPGLGREKLANERASGGRNVFVFCVRAA